MEVEGVVVRNRVPLIASACLLAAIALTLLLRPKPIPEVSTPSTFVADVRHARRAPELSYSNKIFLYHRYVESAFKNLDLARARKLLSSGPIKLQSSPWSSSFSLKGSDLLAGSITLHPTFSVSEDLFDDTTPGATKIKMSDCTFDLDIGSESAETVRKRFLEAGGPLSAVAATSSFQELTDRYPTLLRGRLSYQEVDGFNLNLTLLSDSRDSVTVTYTVAARLGPKQTRYVRWLPLTYRRWEEKMTSVETNARSESDLVQARDFVTSLHRLDKPDSDPSILLETINPSTDLKDVSPEVEGLQLDGVEVPPAFLARFKKLRYLCVSKGKKAKTIDLSFLAGAPIPPQLILDGPLSDESWDVLVKLEQLEDLQLNTDAKPDRVAELARLPRLRRLSLDAPGIDAAVIERLAESSSIKFIVLSEQVHLDRRGIESLAKMKLQGLDLYLPQDVDISPLLKDDLIDLNLMNLKFDAGIVDSILKLSKLQRLGFEGATGLTRDQLLSFSKLRDLRWFHLYHEPKFPGRDLRELRSLLPGEWMQN